MIYYEFTPLDTLFFRGATPMEAGQLTAVSLFPPPVSVFIGAIRTAVLKQKDISFKDYKAGNYGIHSELETLIGKAGAPSPFAVTSFFIKKKGHCFLQAPVSWYLDSKKKPLAKSDYTKGTLIQAAYYAEAFTKLCIASSEANLPFVKAEAEAQPLSALWIAADFFNAPKPHLTEDDFLLNSEVYTVESRTGIGLDANRHVVEGKLYTASHLRLSEGTAFGIGVSKDTGLQERGFLQLGGENRLCAYRKIEAPFDSTGQPSGLYFAAAPVQANEAVLSKLFSSKKLIEIAGWDLHRGFHKPSQAWLPAGAVFTEKINDACISLPAIKAAN